MQELLIQVHFASEMTSVAHGYLLQEGELVRKWMPQGESFAAEAIFQIVIPNKLKGVLQTAHDDIAGHLGVQKTCNRVLQNFYWPCLKKIKTILSVKG